MQYLKQEVKDAIYQAAVQEFLKNGYKSGSLRNIAKQAGCTVGNIYNYYSSKEALFKDIVFPAFEELNLLFHMNEKRVMSPEMVAHKLINEMPRILQDKRLELIILFDKSVGSEFEIAKAKLISVLADDISRHISIYNEGKTTGLINPALSRPLSTSFLEGIFEIIRSTDDYNQITQFTIEFINMYFFWSLD